MRGKSRQLGWQHSGASPPNMKEEYRLQSKKSGHTRMQGAWSHPCSLHTNSAYSPLPRKGSCEVFSVSWKLLQKAGYRFIYTDVTYIYMKGSTDGIFMLLNASHLPPSPSEKCSWVLLEPRESKGMKINQEPWRKLTACSSHHSSYQPYGAWDGQVCLSSASGLAGNHRITEYPKLKGTHMDHQVQL